MIRVSILVADPRLRERLRALVASPRIEVTPDAEGFAESWDLADVIVIDEAHAFIGDADDAAALLVVGDTGEAIRLARRRGAAAWGVVPSNAGQRQLQGAIEAVASGLIVVPPALASVTPAAHAHEEDEIDAEPLTPRELDVLGLTARGLSNRDVARELGISEHTVKFHLAAVYGKLGAGTRTEAVRRALRRGLIDL